MVNDGVVVCLQGRPRLSSRSVTACPCQFWLQSLRVLRCLAACSDAAGRGRPAQPVHGTCMAFPAPACAGRARVPGVVLHSQHRATQSHIRATDASHGRGGSARHEIVAVSRWNLNHADRWKV